MNSADPNGQRAWFEIVRDVLKDKAVWLKVGL